MNDLFSIPSPTLHWHYFGVVQFLRNFECGARLVKRFWENVSR
jgi:hypothetical protein